MAQATFEFSPSNDTAVASQPGRGAGRVPGATAAAAAAAATANSGPAHRAGLPDDATALDRTGFEIGWDHAHRGLTPPLRHLHDHNPVRQGWAAGRAAFGARTLRPGASVRLWLGLRLQAWQHGQAFEEVQVNPAFLSRIDADECPVARVPLMLLTGGADDATVTRLNAGAAYAAGNLAVVSAPVAAAMAHGDWAYAQDQAERLHASEAPALDGLDHAAWIRAAVLASFATPLAHAQAALLPLRVLPPNGVRVINPVQALQVVLTLQFSRAGYARRLLGLAALMPGSEARQAFQIFMHTLLARRLAVGPSPTPQALRHALEDSWADALVNRRWQRLAMRLSAADCELLLQRAAQRQWVVGGSRWLSRECATDGWALQSLSNAQAGVGSPAATPGSTLNLGSQKLAS